MSQRLYDRAMNQEPSNRTEREKGKAKKTLIKIGAVVGLATAFFGGVKLAEGSHDNGPVPSEPTVEAPAVPGPIETANTGTGSGIEAEQQLEAQKNFNEFIASFEIQRDAASFEDITNQYVENYQKWINSGLTVQYDPEIVTNVENNVITFEQKFDPAITDKMYTGSETSQSLVADIQEHIRKSTITDWGISMNVNSDKPYMTDYELVAASVTYSDGATPAEATSFTIHADIHVTDNGNETVGPYRLAHNGPAQMDIVRHETQTYVLDTATNTWKVDDVQFYADSDNNSK